MIRVTTLFAGLVLLVLPVMASAQTSFYGMLTCDAVSAQGGAAGQTSATDGSAAASSNAGAKNAPGVNDSGGHKKGAGGNSGGFKKSKGGANGANANGGSTANTIGGPRGLAAATARSGIPAVVAQEKCYWTLPLEIGNDTATDGHNTFNLNITGSRSSDTGTHTSNTNNSDQFTMSFTGTSLLDDGETRSRQGTWKFTGGTGTLKGVTGTGTYTAVARAAGGMSYDLEGTYELPSMVPSRPAPLGTPLPDASSTPSKPVS